MDINNKNKTLLASRELEFYKQSYIHFCTTTLAHDISILGISVFLIYLMMNIIPNFTNWGEVAIFNMATMCFALCIVWVVKIFDKNKENLIAIIREDEYKIKSSELELDNLQWILNCAFYSGMVLFVVLVGVTTFSKYM